jgi:uncharacterized membrane protein (GlpM family)
VQIFITALLARLAVRFLQLLICSKNINIAGLALLFSTLALVSDYLVGSLPVDLPMK